VHLMKELKFKNKKAASFGCYGWSGESTKILNEMLASAGFDVIGDGFKNLWNPDEEAQKKAVEYGREIANII
jgi:anaerobic nitric oxide reductase flavorubredoxin